MKEWLSQHKTWVHSVAGAIVTAGIAYASSTTVQQLVNNIIGPHPRIIGVLGSASALILLYTQTQKPKENLLK